MVNVRHALRTGRIWPGVKEVALSVTIVSVMAAGLVVAPPPEPARAASGGTRTLVSKSWNGVIGNFGSFAPSFSADGVIRVYDPATNTFGAYNPSGTTRTFFTPKRGIDYWTKQPGTSPWSP